LGKGDDNEHGDEGGQEAIFDEVLTFCAFLKRCNEAAQTGSYSRRAGLLHKCRSSKPEASKTSPISEWLQANSRKSLDWEDFRPDPA
jgi:uncharacterized protein YggL (DUF469 family)